MPRRHEDVVRQLTDDIVDGALPEGSRLPTEQELAARLGAGRGAVRESLRTLQARGLIDVRPGQGAVVRHGDRWRLGELDVLMAVLDHGHDHELLIEAIAARAGLERIAADAATARATR